LSTSAGSGHRVRLTSDPELVRAALQRRRACMRPPRCRRGSPHTAVLDRWIEQGLGCTTSPRSRVTSRLWSLACGHASSRARGWRGPAA